MTQKMTNYSVQKDEEGMRLDRLLRRLFPHLSQGFFQKQLRKKNILLNAQKATAPDRLKEGDVISLLSSFASVPTLSSTSSSVAPSPLLLQTAHACKSWIVHQESDFLVIHKPQGIASQGGTNLKVSVDQALAIFLEPTHQKPYLVHRLDKDTSGLMIIALSPYSAKIFGEFFKEKKIRKTYLAVGVGHLEPSTGQWDNWIAKRPDVKGEKMHVVSPQEDKAAYASCTYRVLDTHNNFNLVELIPTTGRMHQLRLQMAHYGCPILGDGKYGGAKAHPDKRTSLHLHAHRLNFCHPRTHNPLQFVTPVPKHFQITLQEKKLSSPEGS